MLENKEHTKQNLIRISYILISEIFHSGSQTLFSGVGTIPQLTDTISTLNKGVF